VRKKVKKKGFLPDCLHKRGGDKIVVQNNGIGAKVRDRPPLCG